MFRKLLLACCLLLAGVDNPAIAQSADREAPLVWMAPVIIARQAAAESDEAREAIANERAKLLLAAMTLPQKMQQLTGARPEILPELPHCLGARHVSGIAQLAIPTFRITNGPVGLGQNDCVAASIKQHLDANPRSLGRAYTDPTSARATALPSAMGVAASFDPQVAAQFGGVIAAEMNNLALHVFEAPGVNLARLPILGRNFEYFGEDPYLSGVMAVAETQAIQRQGLIAMPKHFAANEQETNRSSIQETVNRQVLRELYLLPFEMAVRDGKAASIMCAYNYVNGASSCESRELLTDVLRRDWGFTGYVQSDFFAMKSTAATLKAGMDHEMPLPQHWAPDRLHEALQSGALQPADIDTALERRYTQMFKAGIFDRPLVQTPIDFAVGGRAAREIGIRSAVLLQNNGALPLRADIARLLVIGKATQVYAQQAVTGGSIVGQPMGAGGGSSDVVPSYTVTPIDGLHEAMGALGNRHGVVQLALVDDRNERATIDGRDVAFADVVAAAGAADAVVIMAGTIAEEGADRASFTHRDGLQLAAPAAEGGGLDWYAERSNTIAVAPGGAIPASDNAPVLQVPQTTPHNSQTAAMIRALMAARSTSGRSMAGKTTLVLKDNAGVALDPALVGRRGPAILEVWFPGQEDGNITADLLFGRHNPSGKLPVTFPVAGRGFLDHIAPAQFPGVAATDGSGQTVTYGEQLHIGYRWYDANIAGNCAARRGRNPCVAFAFGHGLSYTRFRQSRARLTHDAAAQRWQAQMRITNTGRQAGAQVVQAYVSLPASANALGVPQPPRRLAGFQRIELAAGASAEVTITIDPAASHHPLSVWSEADGKWVIPNGEFTIWLGTSSSPADLQRAGSFRQ